MNAAFLLVTSALVVGQGTAVDKKPADKPAAAAPAAASCGHNCGCDGFGHRLRDRLRSAFSRDCNDACKPTACPTHHVHTPIFRSSCDDCGRTRLFNWQPACREPKACAPAKCHDPCDRPNLLSRLRDRFQRGDRCCTSTAAPAKKTEKIETTPKKLPTDKDKGGKEEVRIETNSTPVAPAAIQVNPQIPAVDITPVPAPAPRVSGDRRDPF